ncbi:MULTISPECIES: SDR family oxidoreductase [unclassified Brenneria]|uniref:SDR family oxidoreductase n=1 Tax=unclassified Brenneria TaxID=2634434 RepID=UPI0029C31526|nr:MULTISPECIES: SDR family oxidoreductase [unclassified Brenneria]MDX5628174.1 SDR family oxidoreductase [Brenneria sp. L3-3Z]MDX5694806.1 SDR family oxidoreductase [Brenneria sp. L4-2C]
MQKTVLITGCSSGIGLIAAQDLHKRGYRVLAACRRPEDVERMAELGLEGIELNLDDAGSVEKAAARVIALTGNRLYGLFNNAGYGLYGLLSGISRRQLEHQFSSNLFGTHQLTQLLLPAMLPHGEGRIIQTSSVMGLVSTPGRGAYAASKFALEAWSDTLRMELYGSGLHVSLIEPGPLSTRFTANVDQTQTDKPVTNPGIAKRFTLPPEAVLPKLHHALESPRPKLRYPVTLVAHSLSWLRRLLPGRYLDNVLRTRS